MENLTTQDSLKIIQTVIDQRKQKYEENGAFLIFWGILIMIAGVSQYTMIQLDKGDISGYAWLFTMVPGAIISYVWGTMNAQKAKKHHKNYELTGWIWAFAGILAMTTGFFFGNKFGIGFTAMLFTPFCMAAMASALATKNFLWVSLTIIGTIVGYSSVFISFIYHPLISALVAFLVFLLPGIQLHLNHKKRKNV